MYKRGVTGVHRLADVSNVRLDPSMVAAADGVPCNVVHVVKDHPHDAINRDGRPRFDDGLGRATFPSMIVVYRSLSEMNRVQWQRSTMKSDSLPRWPLTSGTSHGQKGLAAVVLGSETTKVLTHSQILVLVCR